MAPMTDSFDVLVLRLTSTAHQRRMPMVSRSCFKGPVQEKKDGGGGMLGIAAEVGGHYHNSQFPLLVLCSILHNFV